MMKTLIEVLILAALGLPALAQQETTATTPSGPTAAIYQIADDYENAFNKADADKLGEMFAEDVEYIDEDGDAVSGRDAIVALLKKNFTLNPGARMEIDIQSVRSLTPDVAVERGQTVTTAKDGDQTTSAYTAIHVLKDGKWHIKQLVDSPVPNPSPGEMLSDLNWMIGTWREKDGDAEIETKVNWAAGNNYLTRNFKVTVADEITLQGWQIIGWDPAQKKIRSWMFDTDGGFQEGTWTRNGDTWRVSQAGFIPDGGTISSMAVLQRIGDDKFAWESTSRTLDGDPQPSLPRIEIVRTSK